MFKQFDSKNEIYGENTPLIKAVIKLIWASYEKTAPELIKKLAQIAKVNDFYLIETSVYGHLIKQKYDAFPGFNKQELELIAQLYKQLAELPNKEALNEPKKTPVCEILKNICQQADELCHASGKFPKDGYGKPVSRKIYPSSSLKEALETFLPIENQNSQITYSKKR